MTWPARVNAPATSVTLATQSCFAVDHTDEEMSAIDRFMEKRQNLATLYTPELIGNHTLSSLILLGVVSAVESYCREILRRVILLDKQSQEACAGKVLSYGAARFHRPEMLPEAFLEHSVFSSGKNIKNALADFVGFNKVSTGVTEALKTYDLLCELRHCAVHRFGRLGVKNAIELGLEVHAECIEKPMALSFDNVQLCLEIADNVVREINNFLFEGILARSVSTDLWTWDLRSDKRKFMLYFNLFYSTASPPSPPASVQAVYNAFRVRALKQVGSH